MTFKVNGALFQQTAEKLKERLKDKFDASKNYPQYDGILNVPADQAYLLAQYLMEGQPVGDRQEIPVQISGWKKQSGSGQAYLSLQFAPHYKYEKSADVAPAPAAAPAQPAPAALADSDFPF
jgi:hypothetical protein